MLRPPVAESKIIIPSKLEHLPRVRDLVESMAEQAGFSPQETQRIVTAAFEAVANAVTHGSPVGAENTVCVDVLVYPDKMVVEVADQGPGFGKVSSREMPDVSSSRGRGIPLMHTLVDDVQLVAENGGKVILTKYRR
jgi:anti-sigma regulatory factor (Ser/Thr protein kinase)